MSSNYTIGQVIQHLGFQVQVFAIGEEQPDGFGGRYRMIGIQYLNGVRSSIVEKIEEEKRETKTVYIVKRHYVRGQDYLKAIGNHGTTCIGARHLAATYPTQEAARAAARKARRVCMTWNATKHSYARPYPRVNFQPAIV